MQTTSKNDRSLLRQDLDVTHQRIIVGGNDHIHILNSLTEASPSLELEPGKASSPPLEPEPGNTSCEDDLIQAHAQAVCHFH